MKKHSQMHKRKAKVLRGTIKITPKPLGFIIVPERERDIIVFEENLNCALDRDEVEVEVIGRERGKDGESREKGRVLKIIKRHKTDFVGVIEKREGGFYFVPDDIRFYRDAEIRTLPVGAQIKTGTKALARIEWSASGLSPKAKVLEIIGEKGEHEAEMRSILLDKGIFYDFPKEVEKEAEESAKKSMIPLVSRVDFRGILTFTIDPADAKDFDDALSYREIDNNTIEVGVHIADVSHFIRPGGALDREARKRGFSTYLVDRTVPMLPEVLSNDLCSLKPDEDRFAFSAVFEIEKASGKVIRRWFGKTIIKSCRRFSYEEAQKELEAEGLELGDKNFSKELKELNRLANIYREENRKNGAIEFETDEVKFELDNSGKPLRIYKKPRLDTMKMIEEWMLLANREVAKFISQKIERRGGVSIYRIHDLPNMEKLEELSIFVRALGHDLPVKKGSVDVKDLNTLLKQIEGHSAESLVKTAAIRSMSKAVYSTQNIGHFGLAFEYYTHFTSPIRRYPDLMIHRILDSYLNNRPISKNEFAKFEKIAHEASEKEVIIAEAERDSIKYKQVEYMQSKIGSIFECVISGVTEWGIYVEDPNTKSEGMIRLRDLSDDYYVLDEKNYCVIGERTKKKYSLGDPVRVRLASADLDRKTLDFKPI
jgi:ribonuclease R